MTPDEYLKQGVDGRREADYTEAYNVDKNTDEVEPKLDVLHADALSLAHKLDTIIATLGSIASKLDTANTHLTKIEENTDKDNNGNN